MKFYIGYDHAGFNIKNDVIKILENLGHEMEDLGDKSGQRVDYPDFAHKVSLAVRGCETSNGILICGTGIGMSMSANRHKGIRAALCHDAYTAGVTKQHNDANILCFGERIVGLGVVESMLRAWCENEFEGGRHSCRVGKIED